LGILVTALAGVIVTKQAFPLLSVAIGSIFTGIVWGLLLSVAIGSIFTGIVWGLLLSGSYALIRFLSNAFGRK
ncbi:hypothetical protein KJB78_13585, partial [Staphylococcus aureus]|nr:hypothetical protein [Staphylococcus aureus]